MADNAQENSGRDAVVDGLMQLVKLYARIDYTDDDELLPILIGAALSEMDELIPSFDRENMKDRQRLLVLVTVKELYDNRSKYGRDQDKLRAAASSMLLSEMYEG